MIVHGSPRFQKYVLDMNRSAMSNLFEVLEEGRANGQSPSESLDVMLRRRAAVYNRPLLNRVAALRGYP